jgi:ParB family chromosome partitioning protein
MYEMIFKMQISMLIDHPRNMEIYGEEDQKQFDELVEQIRLTGWIKPILINRNFMIISGHRRVRAARVLGRTEIEVEKFMGDDDQELERLILENYFREKSTLIKVLEAEVLIEIEQRKAEERRQYTAMNNFDHGLTVESFPPSGETGKVREIGYQ